VTKEQEPGLDSVLAILDLVQARAPALTADQIQSIELEVRQRYGGVWARIAKRKRHPTQVERRKIVLEALGDAPDEVIQRANGISRATLLRYVKRGPG
jgi:hypothetical protein